MTQLKAVIALGPWDDPPMQAALSVPALVLGADPAMDTTAGTRPGSLYDSFPATTPRLLFLSSQGSVLFDDHAQELERRDRALCRGLAARVPRR
jgi:hypothetical protein